MPIEVVSQQASTVDDILKREVAILKPNAGRCGNLINSVGDALAKTLCWRLLRF